MIERCPEIDGFYGASSMERLPTEIALTAQVKRFTDIRRTTARPKARTPRKVRT
jgi:predicted TIM-barrel enzyme